MPIQEESAVSSNYTRIPGSSLMFGVTIFISAFLLFQVQLVLGKFLLPWFGGTSSVWTTCLLFFQFLLFGGYFYAHKISTSLSFDRQTKVHFVFLAVAAAWVLFLWYIWGSPFLPDAAWKPIPGSAPVAGILKLLALAIGVPFLLLSSTGPLLQKWYYEIRANDRSEPPYFLYALSNAGSLIGLLSYPILLEPNIGLDKQSRIWGIAFLFVLVCGGGCAWITRRSNSWPDESAILAGIPVDNNGPAPEPRSWIWFLLPALGSVMLLATTNLLTQDVAPVPLLWVLPLSVYLLTFVFTFQTKSWYFRGLFHPMFAVTALLAVIALFRGTDMHVVKQVGVFLGMLFAACMVCHGELARLKPAGKHLTRFYLTIAGGGAFGGIFVGIIAPFIFPAIWEYHIGLWAVAALLLFVLFTDRRSWLHKRKADVWVPIAFGAVFLLPKYLAGIGLITIPARIGAGYNTLIFIVVALLVGMILGSRWLPRLRWPWPKITAVASLLVLTVALVAQLTKHAGDLVYRERNFYGALSVHRIWDTNVLQSNLTLMHGRITHGIQLEQDRKLATTYYDTKSGVGLALLNSPRRAHGAMRVGAIGLGVGTIATYARPRDFYRFYEINPAVIRLARGKGGYFSFLRDSAGQVEIEPGDARLSLEAEAARHDFQNFDVLIVDAFNGDSVPVHLLTREAMKLYLSHLRDRDSVIAVHISNIAVDLAPVVASLGNFYGMHGTLVIGSVERGVIMPSEWILLTQGNSFNTPEIQDAGKPILAFDDVDNDRLWTDDYTDVLTLLNYHGLSLKLWPHIMHPKSRPGPG